MVKIEVDENGIVINYQHNDASLKKVNPTVSEKKKVHISFMDFIGVEIGKDYKSKYATLKLYSSQFKKGCCSVDNRTREITETL